MLTAYRIFKTKHAAAWHDGEGAFRYGGRWNMPGMRVMYASSTLSLAMLEMLVNLNSEEILGSYSYASLEFEESSVLPVEQFRKLPKNWNTSPPPIAVQEIGTDWASSNASLILAVPSSVVPHEQNYVINLSHPDFPNINLRKPQELKFDKRLK